MFYIKYYFVFTGSTLNPIRESIYMLVLIVRACKYSIPFNFWQFTDSITSPWGGLFGLPSLSCLRKRHVILIPYLWITTLIILHFNQANYVMKRKADGTTTIRVLMDNKASKNSAIHKAIIETGRFEPRHRFSKANFCSSSFDTWLI